MQKVEGCEQDVNGNCPEDSGYVGVNTDNDFEELISDCNDLSNLSGSASFQQRMQELITNTTGNTEIGYWGRTDSNGKTTYAAGDKFQSQPNVREIRPTPPTSPINSFIHNHFNNGAGSLQVFSPGDLYTVYNMYVNGLIADLDNFVMVIATPGNSVSDPNDDTVYAITVSNTTEFINLANILAVTPHLINRSYGAMGINQSISTSLNEERLARLFKESKIGLTLYRGDKNNLNNWTRLKIKNNDQLKENKCN